MSSPLGRAAGYLIKEHIDLTYKESTLTIEISTKSWDELLAVICEKFQINSKITSIYRVKSDGRRALATEMSDFIDKETYYLRTEIDEQGMFLFGYNELFLTI